MKISTECLLQKIGKAEVISLEIAVRIFTSLVLPGNFFLRQISHRTRVGACSVLLLSVCLSVFTSIGETEAQVAKRTVDVSTLEGQIETTVKVECGRLARWPKMGLSGEEIAQNLSVPLKRVEDSPIGTPESALIADLYRCVGAARMVSTSDDLLGKISDALPYLERSLAFQPSQTLLKKNVAFLKQFVSGDNRDAKTFCMTLLQVFRGKNDPDIPELADIMVEVLKKN